jgi:hypothetical protein
MTTGSGAPAIIRKPLGLGMDIVLRRDEEDA